MSIDSDFFNKEVNQEAELSEDSLRLALERLGNRSNKRPAQQAHKKIVPDQRRRRFVQEGQVVVEHHQVSRAALRSSPVQSDDHSEEIARLRNLLKMEQRRAEDAQRDLGDMQVQLRTLETHLVHEKLHVTELKTKCAEAEQALLEAQVQLSVLREESQKRHVEPAGPADETAEPVVKRGRGRPPRVREVPAMAGEPEPVRWWKD
ncbi:hypothetical protein GCM10007207_24080 [Asaia siamensis]|uniref:Uncharacterized protein n=1 Tax=Asaia siamensis TaxID=110479 RepID=A0ABQ1MB66_9PROT|nr:hypothetical protein AA0323_1718 [Asaia siamensis NRIC 0323]GGC37731.1 hypothetical protein GCM10007207_24080 [Asaia siamensis]